MQTHPSTPKPYNFLSMTKITSPKPQQHSQVPLVDQRTVKGTLQDGSPMTRWLDRGCGAGVASQQRTQCFPQLSVVCLPRGHTLCVFPSTLQTLPLLQGEQQSSSNKNNTNSRRTKYARIRLQLARFAADMEPSSLNKQLLWDDCASGLELRSQGQ